MFYRVWEQAQRSGASEVILATDDRRIAEAATRLSVDCVITSNDHSSGTDRIAEVAALREWADEDIVVNVQGDEPLIPPELISQVAKLLAANKMAAIATLTTALDDELEFTNNNCVKVVVDRHNFALYFSRSAIPHMRDGGIAAISRRHVGLYAYRVATLRLLTSTPVCELERSEKLEQLRALWLGQKIIVAEACSRPARGVDTPEDLEAVRAAFSKGA